MVYSVVGWYRENRVFWVKNFCLLLPIVVKLPYMLRTYKWYVTMRFYTLNMHKCQKGQTVTESWLNEKNNKKKKILQKVLQYYAKKMYNTETL